MKKLLVAALLTGLTSPALAQTAPTPPIAATHPHAVTAPFGASRNDDYYWLRDDTRKSPEMLADLAAENAYTDAMLASVKPLANTVFNEIVSHVKQDDSSPPWRQNGYYYYTRFETGANYPILARRKGSLDAPEQVMLDEPKMGEGKGFFAVGGWGVSQDGHLLAWSDDTVGRRQYTLRVKNLETGAVLADVIPDMEGSPVWSDDGKTLFYVDKDPVTLLSKRIKAHMLGTDPATDRVVYTEADDSFYMGLGRTVDDKFICIMLDATVSTEQRCTSAAAPGDFAVLAPREREFRYSADHNAGRWVIRTNWNAKNYKVMTVADADAAKGRAAWRDRVPASDSVFVEDIQPFDGFLAIEERSGGNKRLRLLTDAGKSSFVDADRPAYVMALDVNAEPSTPWVRYSFNSLIDPRTIYEVNAFTGERRLLKAQPVPGYDASRYVTERVWATARDGTKIPVSPGLRKGFRKDGTAAMLQQGYGSYGISSDPYLNVTNQSLLDRGMVYRGRPHPRRAGDGPRLVRPGASAQQEEHLHRLHRRHSLSRRAGLCGEGAGRARSAAARAGC